MSLNLPQELLEGEDHSLSHVWISYTESSIRVDSKNWSYEVQIASM